GGSAGTAINALVERARVPVDGGLRWATGTKPTCDAAHRGTVFYVAGATSVTDTFEVCQKDAGDAYAWVSSAGGAVSSVSGTAGQITVTPTTGAAVVSLPSALTLPGTLTAGGTVNLGTNGLSFNGAAPLLIGDAANQLDMRNGANAQRLNI